MAHIVHSFDRQDRAYSDGRKTDNADTAILVLAACVLLAAVLLMVVANLRAGAPVDSSDSLAMLFVP